MHNDAFQITLSIQWSAKRYPHLQWYNFIPDGQQVWILPPSNASQKASGIPLSFNHIDSSITDMDATSVAVFSESIMQEKTCGRLAAEQ